MTDLSSGLVGIRGEPVVLQDVAVTAVMQDLLGEVTVTQTYRNDEDVNIEAVYTFPLPPDAVLLDLEVSIGDRVLNGVVVERKKAEREYEEAISDGHAVAMLERLESGLYTINVGNLLPKEQATIKFRYALLYKWSGDRLRLLLPTTVAPRYGHSPHQPHQVPESSMAVENLFSLRIEIRGALQTAQFHCPSHAVALERSDESTVLSLRNQQAVMDRDFVLNIRAPQAPRSFAVVGEDGEGVAAVASFQPFFPGLKETRALQLAIVVDCSGSMQGDSITQVKYALQTILDSLQPEDRVTLIAFGNSTKVLSQKLQPCTRTNLDKARAFVEQLGADMGGTQIGGALRAAYKATADWPAADIFLLTDGEVSSWTEVVAEAATASRRIFTVGVGSAVSEAFVRELANSTNGACELVSPREAMADRVVRHFERMRAPRAKRVTVRWPVGAVDAVPITIGPVFEGDTIIAAARLEDRSTLGSSVTLEVETEAGETARQELPLQFSPAEAEGRATSTVGRLAASLRMGGQDEAKALQTALTYQLVSSRTNYLVVAEREEAERAVEPAALRKIDQTSAAGWGGAGRVADFSDLDKPAIWRTRDTSVSVQARVSAMDEMGTERYDIPAFLRKESARWRSRAEKAKVSPPKRLRKLVELINANPSQLSVQDSAGLLREAGLDPELSNVFEHARKAGVTPQAAAAILLARLLDHCLEEHLVTQASVYALPVQMFAREAVEALEKLARSAEALRDVVRHVDSVDLVERELSEPLRHNLDAAIKVRDLLELLSDVKERWIGARA